MRVLHVAQSTRGGAGRAMIGLHHGLRELGIDSQVLTVVSDAEPRPHVSSLPAPAASVSRLAMKGDRVVRRIAGGRARETFHTPLWPTAVPREVQRMSPAIVHLHWLGDMMTPNQIAGITRNHRTVWTLRDLAPLTGGCHYSHGCRRFEGRCQRCPLLDRPWRHDPTFWIHRAKLKALAGRAVTLVTLSRWLAEEARRSALFHGRDAHVVPPGIDTDVFRPRDKSASRSAFGLTHADCVIGFVALDPLGEKRKGVHLLDRALNLVHSSRPGLTAVITATEEELGARPLQASAWLPVGQVREDTRLAMLYSACDVVVVPSTQEGFGKVAAEAIACGVPVVAFGDTGVADAVVSPLAGYLASLRSVEDLAAGIVWGLGQASNDRVRRSRHELVARRFGLRVQAQRYRDIYRSMLQEKHAP